MSSDPTEPADPLGLADLARDYDALRPRLVRVAHAVTGSVAEAEDVVADVWLKAAEASRHDATRPDDLEAWSVVAVSRRALDVLRSARVRREAYVGPWLPEPLVAPLGDGDPADSVTLADQVHYALLVLLEKLSPAERTAWVLHDVFGMEFGEVAQVVGRTPAAVRQLASRARRHLAGERTRQPVERSEHDAVVGAFAAAVVGGELSALVAVLDPDVVLTGDGGGVVNAARRPVLGPDRVGRFLLGTMTRPERSAAATGREVLPVLVNGALGFALVTDGTVEAVAALTVADGRIVRVDLVRNPEKLPQRSDLELHDRT